jgi:sulfatase maturation enzyme AslB (radical SAM superfamily)
LAVEALKNGTWLGPAKLNWTDDNAAWDHVTDYMCSTENLKFVHVIGGEPLMNPRFEQLIDKLLAYGRTDIYLGYTTNGSRVNLDLIKKLNAFRHVDIGISIECTGALNDAIRKGTRTNEVLNNIETYLQYKREAHVYITVRPVPSALSVHTLDDLYRWCADRKIDVMTNILSRPEHLQIRQLPQGIKDRLLKKYQQWKFSEPLPGISHLRDPNRFQEHIDEEIRAVQYWLQQPADADQTQKLYDQIKAWGWLDQPELAKFFEAP